MENVKMKTSNIRYLTSLSDKYYDNKKISALNYESKRIEIKMEYCSLDIDLDLYPELKSKVAEIRKHIVDIESDKQKEVKSEMIKILCEE